MAIEKTGVEVDVSSSFESPTTFEENGMVDHVAGSCGFYDVLNQCFYSNDGTANFIPGPDL